VPLNTIEKTEPHYRGSFSISSKDDMENMFRRVEKHYDFLNRLFSFGLDLQWRRKSANILGFTNDSLILDLGAGTGDFSIVLRKESKVNVIAVDLVEEMLTRFESKINNEENWAKFVVGDGENLPFSENEFDGVITAFVGRNFLDLDRGLSEAKRVLKKDGKIGFLEFCTPKNSLIRGLRWIYFHTFIPLVGWFFIKGNMNAYRYLVKSIEQFYSVIEMTEIFKNAGFKHVESHTFNLGTVALITGEK
tara:strand:+ start:3455 stop:4198 length:744 start_codon:yes stop_codon:yes gene_type:complete